MGDRPIEIFLLCDFEDTPLAKALSDQLTASGIVAACGHDLNEGILDRCQSVAVCVGENTSLAPKRCTALQDRFAAGGFRVVIIYLPNAYWEDYDWFPTHPIKFRSKNDPEALRELIAIARPSLKVFLCHTTTDKPAVRNLHASLLSDGFRPWLDEKDLIAGQDWELAIRNEVRASQIVIVCLSRAAVTKTGFVQKEIRLALDVADEQPEGSIFIIPVRLEECDVPSRLRKWQWVDLWVPDGYEGLSRALRLRAKELARTVACGLTSSEVAMLATWRPDVPPGAILIVSGNPDLLEFLRRLLEDWTVVTAESAQQAVDVMGGHTPEIALLDYSLPDANGVAFGMRLRQKAPATAIIITSVDEPTHEDMLTCGLNDFILLMKPFRVATLIGLLDRIRRRQVRCDKVAD